MEFSLIVITFLFSIKEICSSLAHQQDENSNLDYCLDCSIVDCVPKIEQWDCPIGYFYLDNIYFGCCPACVKYLETGDNCDLKSWPVQKLLSETTELECNPTQERVLKKEFVVSKRSKDILIPAFHVIRCSPDSTCNNGKCELKDERPCSKQKIQYQKWVEKEDCNIYEWEPRCNQNGFFDHIQSKSNLYHSTKKYCSDPNGLPISGSFSYEDENPFRCACSRKKNEMIKVAGIKDVSIHCSYDGSFEKLQCENGLCWCMHPSYPNLSFSTVVPESLMSILHCYQDFEVGTMYLRRCESRSITKTKIESILQKHGHYWSEQYPTKCEYDGSFGRTRCTTETEKVCRCIDPNGNPLEGYSAEIGTGKIDCRCARDHYLGLTEFECVNLFGGYKELQSDSNDEWCIDESGFQWSMRVMQDPSPGSGKRCRIDNCKESLENCKDDNCFDCWKCGECTRNPGESCFP